MVGPFMLDVHGWILSARYHGWLIHALRERMGSGGRYHDPLPQRLNGSTMMTSTPDPFHKVVRGSTAWIGHQRKEPRKLTSSDMFRSQGKFHVQ